MRLEGCRVASTLAGMVGGLHVSRFRCGHPGLVGQLLASGRGYLEASPTAGEDCRESGGMPSGQVTYGSACLRVGGVVHFLGCRSPNRAPCLSGHLSPGWLPYGNGYLFARGVPRGTAGADAGTGDSPWLGDHVPQHACMTPGRTGRQVAGQDIKLVVGLMRCKNTSQVSRRTGGGVVSQYGGLLGNALRGLKGSRGPGGFGDRWRHQSTGPRAGPVVCRYGRRLRRPLACPVADGPLDWAARGYGDQVVGWRRDGMQSTSTCGSVDQ